MTTELSVILEDEVDFESYEEQKRLVQKVDEETFTAPEFIGSSEQRENHLKVKLRIQEINIDDCEKIGNVIAEHFDTELEDIRIK